MLWLDNQLWKSAESSRGRFFPKSAFSWSFYDACVTHLTINVYGACLPAEHGYKTQSPIGWHSYLVFWKLFVFLTNMLKVLPLKFMKPLLSAKVWGKQSSNNIKAHKILTHNSKHLRRTSLLELGMKGAFFFLSSLCSAGVLLCANVPEAKLHRAGVTQIFHVEFG